MIKLSPSILAADPLNLGKAAQMAHAAGCDELHFDVMDGHFVPNLTIGAPVVRALRRVTDLPLDVHLMITNPDVYLDDFIRAGSDYITIHLECDADIAPTLMKIREAGIKAALSIKPATPVDAVCEYLELLDMVLIMSVEPGFGGQKFIPESLEKLRGMRALIDSINPACLLEIDGGVTRENAGAIIEAGADILVAGFAVFGAPDMAEAIAGIRAGK